jgi:hypothetical protein
MWGKQAVIHPRGSPVVDHSNVLQPLRHVEKCMREMTFQAEYTSVLTLNIASSKQSLCPPQS